jgi:hypothetical protein
MSSSANSHLPSAGPGPGDCYRLLTTLKHEYIPGLRVELSWYPVGKEQHGLKLELLDDSLVTQDGKDLVNVWAAKTFGNQLHLISEAQLYDLLIVGYRQIERFFAVGEAAAPARRVK